MKKQIIAGALMSMLSFAAFACDAPHASKDKAEHHAKIHQVIIEEMNPQEKADYEKVSKLVDELSPSEKKALHIKLMHEHMSMTKEQRKAMHKEHMQHMKHIKEALAKKENAKSSNSSNHIEKDTSNFKSNSNSASQVTP